MNMMSTFTDIRRVAQSLRTVTLFEIVKIALIAAGIFLAVGTLLR